MVKLAVSASNAFALITGALLLGFGLVEIPEACGSTIWWHAARVFFSFFGRAGVPW